MLYCVLDWGLGHATRSIPLISHALNQNCEVQIASDGQALAYLQAQFPELVFHQLVGYNAKYPTSFMFVNVFSMANRLRNAMAAENKQIHGIVQSFRPEIIISDNRYGCHHATAKNILLSHQLKLLAGNQIGQLGADLILRKKLDPFNELWVPDYAPPDNLTGSMSELKDERVRYIGPLSSMKKISKNIIEHSLLILLSGPEPARTKLENRLMELNLNAKFNCQLIRGSNSPMMVIADGIDVLDMANPEEVSAAICSAKYIICRSGYSTIMDLQKLGKLAIYIPTPGQPEQKYLAKIIHTKRRGVTINEKDLSVNSILNAIKEIELLDFYSTKQPANFELELDRILSV